MVVIISYSANNSKKVLFSLHSRPENIECFIFERFILRKNQNIRVLKNELLHFVSRSIELVQNISMILDPINVSNDPVSYCIIVVFQSLLEVFNQLVERTAFCILLLPQLFYVVILPKYFRLINFQLWIWPLNNLCFLDFQLLFPFCIYRIHVFFIRFIDLKSHNFYNFQVLLFTWAILIAMNKLKIMKCDIMRAQPTQKLNISEMKSRKRAHRIKVDDEAKLVELEPTAFSARSVKPNHPSAVVIMNKFARMKWKIFLDNFKLQKQAVKQPQSSRTASGWFDKEIVLYIIMAKIQIARIRITPIFLMVRPIDLKIETMMTCAPPNIQRVFNVRSARRPRKIFKTKNLKKLN